MNLERALAKCLHSVFMGHALQLGLFLVQNTCNVQFLSVLVFLPTTRKHKTCWYRDKYMITSEIPFDDFTSNDSKPLNPKPKKYMIKREWEHYLSKCDHLVMELIPAKCFIRYVYVYCKLNTICNLLSNLDVSRITKGFMENYIWYCKGEKKSLNAYRVSWSSVQSRGHKYFWIVACTGYLNNIIH